MAKRILSNTTITQTATGDAANLADNTYCGYIQGGSATQRVNILEVFLGGQAAASAPTYMVLGRDSQVAAGTPALGTGQSDAAMDAATAALAAPPVTGNTVVTTKPQRSATLHLLNLSFNAFGGVVRWLAAPGEEISIVGASANTGEVSLSAFTGGTVGALGSHIVYEPL